MIAQHPIPTDESQAQDAEFQNSGLLFSPPPDDVPRILHDLAYPDVTLWEVAAAHDTNVQALSLWMARPDIAGQLQALESASARRARLIAAGFLSKAATALARIIEEFNQPPPAPPESTPNPRPPSAASVRSAASLLLRIANFSPRTAAATTPRPAESPGAPPRPARAASGSSNTPAAPELAAIEPGEPITRAHRSEFDAPDQPESPIDDPADPPSHSSGFRNSPVASFG